ncbi:MAG: hypothetical protein IPO18_20540 [bacterium]|nr:hypothetical protein [bacterium]
MPAYVIDAPGGGGKIHCSRIRWPATRAATCCRLRGNVTAIRTAIWPWGGAVRIGLTYDDCATTSRCATTNWRRPGSTVSRRSKPWRARCAG